MVRFLPALLGAVLGVLLTGSGALAQVPLTTEAVGFFNSPVELTAPAGDDRLFVMELNSGQVKIIKNGQVLGTPFLDLGGQVQTGGERGMLGMAFHPLYAINGYFFVAYTRFGGDTVIERFQRASWNPDQVAPGSQQTVFVAQQPYENHNGGCIRFGPDGYLYIGSGDGGGNNDPDCNSQNLGSLLGKILRIDVDAIDITGSYGIPVTNPFLGWPGARPEIWVYGLRNPWRFSFDRQTGDLWIGDVGELQREEIDFAPAGVGGWNFGWRVLEGTLCNAAGGCAGSDCSSGGLSAPVWEYGHDAAGGCSVTGGFIYRGCEILGLNGTYFTADFCSGKLWSFGSNGYSIWSLAERQNEITAPGGSPITQVTSIGEDGFGELYFITIGGGVYKLVSATGPKESCGSLVASPRQISAQDGGVVQFQLDAPDYLAFSPFFMLGSSSGSWPGLTLDGVLIPLNPDAYLLNVLDSANTGPFVNWLSALDAKGRATAVLNLAGASLPPAAIGKTFTHAFLVFDGIGQVLFSSAAEDLQITP